MAQLMSQRLKQQQQQQPFKFSTEFSSRFVTTTLEACTCHPPRSQEEQDSDELNDKYYPCGPAAHGFMNFVTILPSPWETLHMELAAQRTTTGPSFTTTVPEKRINHSSVMGPKKKRKPRQKPQQAESQTGGSKRRQMSECY